MVVRLLTRRDCGLCEEAGRLLTELGLEYEALDIDSDPALQERYRDVIPVVLLDGREVARAPLTRRKLESALGGRRPRLRSRLRG